MHRGTIRNANSRFSDWQDYLKDPTAYASNIEIKKQEFREGCAGNKCLDAAYYLLGTLADNPRNDVFGPPCDVLKHASTNGDGIGVVGSRSEIARYGGILLLEASQAIYMYTAYNILRTDVATPLTPQQAVDESKRLFGEWFKLAA